MDRDVVFVITPIGTPGSDVRRRSDDLFDLVIEPVIDACDGGLVAVRGDKIDRPGSITEGIVEHILGSKVVIVDLAGANPNVYYEMGIADSFGIPTVRLSDDPASLPFDAKDHNAITLVSAADGALLGRDVETCRAALRAQLDHALADGFTATSIVVRHAKVAQIDSLAASLDTGDEQDKALAAVLEKLAAIEQRLDRSEPAASRGRRFLTAHYLGSKVPLGAVALLYVLAQRSGPVSRDVWERAGEASPIFRNAGVSLESRDLVETIDGGRFVGLAVPRSVLRELFEADELEWVPDETPRYAAALEKATDELRSE